MNVPLSTYLFDRIELFLTCGEGWDGGTGKQTNHVIIGRTLSLLQRIQCENLPEPSLCMGASGEIVILWSFRKSHDLCFEVYTDSVLYINQLGASLHVAELNDETLTALIESAKKVYHGTQEEKAAT